MNKAVYRLFGESVQTRAFALILIPFDLFDKCKEQVKK